MPVKTKTKAKPKTKKLAPKPKAKPKAKTASKSIKPAAKKASGLPEQLHAAALKVLDERQGEDILSVDLRGRSALADYLIIASGRSGRQIAAMADYLREAFAKLGARKIHIEGAQQGDWVLLDAGDVLIHLFRPEVRKYYQIEDIWGSKRR